MVMTKRKERTLNELYNVTVLIKEPKNTPVLSGSCRMQGPTDETDYNDQMNMVSFRVDKAIRRHSKIQKIQSRAESGTCNVCSAPCSSCLHINQAPIMGSKTGESFDETSREQTFSYSVNDVIPTLKRKTCETGQHTASETSNVINVNSSHDSLSENAESKVNIRTSVMPGASEDVGIVGEQHTSNPQKRDSDKSNVIDKFEDLRNIEGHDDNISCVSKTNDTAKLSSSGSGIINSNNLPPSVSSPNALDSEASCPVKCDVEGSQNNSGKQKCNEEFIQKGHPPISISTDFSSHNLELIEKPLLKDINDRAGSGNVQNMYPKSPSGKSLYCNPSLKDLELESCSHLYGEPSESSRECLNPSMIDGVVSGTLHEQQTAPHTSDHIQDSKTVLVGGNSDHSMEYCTKLEAQTNNNAGDPFAEDLNSVEQLQVVENARELISLPGSKETSIKSDNVDESDESDIVEHDVKVCDICGDAGREDLLAVCCRCSDGAEHTYCMRDNLDKVPEGDWLCEECKFDEEIKTQEKDKRLAVDLSGRYQPSGHAGSENTGLYQKFDRNDAEVEVNKTEKDSSSVSISRKRHMDDVEVSSVAKKPALEPTIGSPKTSGPNRIGVLSRNSSFKNLDRGKVKPAHHFSAGAHPVNDTSESASPTLGSRQQLPRGALLKSNSFSAANSKPKVKLVDEVVLQKQKSIREPASLDAKDVSGRVMGKSISFRAVNSSRLSSCEPKVKMLSPNFSHTQDLKGLKQVKDRNFVERKNSFKSERPLVSSTMTSSTISSPKVDKKLAARGDTVSFSSTSNNRESKAVQSDSKLNPLLKPVNHGVRKGSEVPVPLGEGKRTNDRPIYKVSEGQPDVLHQARESTNLGEKVKENSIRQPRQSNTAGGKSDPCTKCKDVGHSVENCKVDCPLPFSPDLHASRSSKEVIDKDNKLKAAIEAAMLKKPGIYRKNRVPDQSDEVSVSSINCEDQLSNSSNSKNLVATKEDNEGRASALNSSADSGNHVKQFMLPAETVTTKSGNDRPEISPGGKHFSMDLPNHDLGARSVRLNMSAIPEHEYIWQGCFEVHKSGKYPDICDGFQAHLSTCASPRVIETVNKFSHKVLLNEVPRSSIWPIQFAETGVNEDHIALFFFAKDHENYEKSYKIVLESMIRHDLALIGSIDGVELLIFPSNQLPPKSQRWNMMFFLWGVFRGKRVNCFSQLPGSPKICSPKDMPTALMFVPQNFCSLGPLDNSVPTCNRARNVASDAHFLIDLSRATIDEDRNTNVVSPLQEGERAKNTEDRQDDRLNTSSLSTIQKIPLQSQPEIRCRFLGHVDSDLKLIAEPQAAVQDIKRASDISTSEKMPVYFSSQHDGRVSFKNFSKVSAVQELVSSETVSEENRLHKMGTDEDQLKYSRKTKADKLLEAEVAQGRETIRVSNEKELYSWPLNKRKLLDLDCTETKPGATFSVSNQTVPLNVTNSLLVVEGSSSKRQKNCFSDLYECTDQTSSSRDDSRRHSVVASFPIKENRYDEGSDDTSARKTLGCAERYFFPVDPCPVNDVGLANNSMPWIQGLSVNEEPLQERFPNLELALGAETKPSKQQGITILPLLSGRVDKKYNQDQPQPPNNAAAMAEDDASLSLSLAFRFPEKDQTLQSVANTEQLLPEEQHVKPPFLFGGLSEK